MRAAGFEPLETYNTNRTPWRCRCLECDTESTPMLSNVNRGRRCGACAQYGLSSSDPALIYLVTSTQHHAIKIGIMKPGSGRVDKHRTHAWQPLMFAGTPFIWPVPTAGQAQNIEHAIIRTWRERLGAEIAITRKDMPQGGFTETASLSIVDPELAASEIIRMVDALDSATRSQSAHNPAINNPIHAQPDSDSATPDHD